MTKLKNLPLLIFDLDGTLIDSATDIHSSMNIMLKRHGRATVDRERLVSHIGDGLTKLVNDFFPEFALSSPENTARVNEFLEIYEDLLIEHTVLYPGVYDFLASYKGPKALATNKNIEPTLMIFKHFGLDQFEWVAITGGDSLAERKPSALQLRHAMEKAQYTPEDTWMIGDGRPDMKSAVAASCKKIAVHYGYSKPEELAIFQPDHVLKSFSDLPKLISNQSGF
ncbi:MAG: HAD hydrolase-like protein [Bdellovibrionaceae bacterium]|nr:HAD hydrolase-like protein [Bdellovibrio sp.]